MNIKDIDPSLGQQYIEVACEKCREKVQSKMIEIEKSNPFKRMKIMANPNKLALEMVNLLCYDCLKAIKKGIKKGEDENKDIS